MAPLAICRRSDFPALFQRLADLGLSELLLFRKIFTRVARLTVLRDKLRRLNILRFPIEIKHLIVRPQIIFRMPMAIKAPRHAVRLCDVNDRHIIYISVATVTADAAVYVRGVIVINVIDGAIQPDPLDWLTALPALLHWLQLGIIFRHLRVTVHACRSVGDVRLRGHFHEAVTIPAVHSQLGHVNIMRKRHRLNRLISDLRVLRRGVIPCRAGQTADDHNHADGYLERYPIRPAWKEIRHGVRQPSRRRCAAAQFATADSSGGELPMDKNCGQDRLLSDAAKWLRLIVPGEQRGFYKFKGRGQNKFLFPLSLPRSLVEIAIGICKNAKFSEERQGNDFDWNCSARPERECFQFRGRIVEPAFHVAERDLFSNSCAARGARDPAGFFSRC